MEMPKFSVLMSVYRNDKAEDFRKAIYSISKDQTCQPSEIILMIDGPVPEELDTTIEELCDEVPTLKPVRLEENVGLGEALRLGMLEVSNDLVARMDADDISEPYRFEKQVAFMMNNPDIAVSGGQIKEFIGSPENIVGERSVPTGWDECLKYFRNRDPLSHVTVIMRKAIILKIGNYLPWHYDEDSFLWARLIHSGYKCANLPDVLVNVRVGKDMYARRGGWKYFKSDAKIHQWKYKHGLISFPRYAYNYVIRFGVQVLMPNSVRGFVYRTFLRKNN